MIVILIRIRIIRKLRRRRNENNKKYNNKNKTTNKNHINNIGKNLSLSGYFNLFNVEEQSNTLNEQLWVLGGIYSII